MNDRPSKSGLIGSGALHAALLGAILIGFSEAPKFDDSGDSTPIETVTQSQFNQIMKGARDGRPQKTPVEKPPLRTAEAETPPPTPEPPKPDTPPPLRHSEETPQDAAPSPPPKPAEAPPPPPREVAAPQPPPPPQDAEIDRPKPRVEPKPFTPPEPPTRPKMVEKPPEKLQPDSVAKFLEKVKTEDERREPARSKAAEALAEPRQTFDPNAIAKAIGEAKPSRQEASLTPLGAPNANAQRMSPSMSAAIDGWLQEAYLNCWSQPPTMPPGDRYVAQVRVAFNPDGSLAVRPLLVNRPSDPAWRAYAESAMRAVLKCNPLHVPPQYAPYFEQWRAKTVHFDPQDAQG